jgi:hypothetical protein
MWPSLAMALGVANGEHTQFMAPVYGQMMKRKMLEVPTSFS